MLIGGHIDLENYLKTKYQERIKLGKEEPFLGFILFLYFLQYIHKN